MNNLRVGLSAALMLLGVAGQAAFAAEVHCLNVYADREWQSTGVTIDNSEMICVWARGLWSHGPQGIQAITPFYDPKGFGKDEPNLVPEVVSRTGALIGRIEGNAAFLWRTFSASSLANPASFCCP